MKFHIHFIAIVTSVFLFTVETKSQALNDTTYVYHSLASALEKPDKVFRLNLSKKQLKDFPQEVFQFKNLQELDISKNKIKELPKEIGTLKSLKRFNASYNKLEVLPSEIGNLTNLVYLGLNRNKIQELPVTIGNMESLEVLEMWDNELFTIPDEISKLTKLKTLEIRGILFSDEEGARIDSLLPNTKVMMSPTCNCKFN
jgi:Leucine-rich repeat (LRR) protein